GSKFPYHGVLLVPSFELAGLGPQTESPSYALLNKGLFFTRSWASRNKRARSSILGPASLEYHSDAVSEKDCDSNKGKDLDSLRISLSDIRLATDNFSETYCIGNGGYGTVYRAELHHFDGSQSSTTEVIVRDELPKRKSLVAIKRISDRVDKQGEHGFLAEIEMLSNCKHQNVVSLLGFCDEGDEMILVYEHISNGSLDDYLGDHDKLINLNWVQRMQICLDIAHGLIYLHTSTKDKPTIIHRDIKSANVLLDDNWVAKIGDFGLSKLNNTDQQSRTLITKTIAGTEVYLDPEYASTGRLKKKSDVYSLGVVLFEIMCGRLAYDNIYHVNNEKGLASVARRRFNDGTLKDMVDPRIMEADKNIFMPSGGLNQDSWDTFTKIAYECVAETQVMRPTVEVVIKELEKAIHFQKKNKDSLHISLEDIQVATQNFSDDKCIEEGRYWKQYEAEILLANANEHTIVAVKQFDRKSEGHQRFLTEIKVLFEIKHKNIVTLAGYCTEMDERIICYEHAPNGRLNKYVQDASLTWMQRINICIDVASGLASLHKVGVRENNWMVHSDIKSCSILLDAEWNAKISNLELASNRVNREQWKHGGDDCGSLGFMDPTRKNYVTQESDWYSFSMILLEMFCGRSAKDLEPWSFYKDTFARCASIEDFINQVAFEGIKEQISAKSCDIFFKVALQCGEDKDGWCVIERLEKALEAQACEDHEIWEPKLPTDYQEIFDSSKIKEDHEIEVRKYSKKRLYELLCKGVLIKKGNAWVSLGSICNREISEIISARNFLFKKNSLRNWQSTPESRFPKVAKMLTISNLKINIRIRTQFLSPCVNYGVSLVFKFCGSKKSSTKPLYVNLTYKMGKETFHAYFATWRDEEWMMIELSRFLNHKKDTKFQVLLESFSQYYCERNGIYIEGIEFRPIQDVNNEESVKIEEVQQILESNMDMVQVQQLATDSEKICGRSANDDEGEKALSLNEVNEKKHLILSAKEVLHDSAKVKCVKLFHLKPSEEPRFQEVIELLPQQVFSIKCKIESQTLLPVTDYMCYLVFKLSEKCHGLHCPVKVRDVLHWKNKEIRILYFRTPSPWNIHNNNRVPKKREDGWMEVIVWKFNSTSELRNDYVPMHLKLMAYEGTMSGLIVGGLEIRPM
ncbi:kinase-like domain, phloem protein 2-like protein, partial [Tanacetum coccineum]